MALTPTETLRARLLSAALCRIVDYHAAATTRPSESIKTNDQIMKFGEARRQALTDAEAALTVAVENIIDAGALE